MIPHHSMAVYMSKKLLEKTNNNYTNPNTNLKNFLTNLINTQQEEIKFLKK